jgi:hypothetical protein
VVRQVPPPIRLHVRDRDIITSDVVNKLVPTHISQLRSTIGAVAINRRHRCSTAPLRHAKQQGAVHRSEAWSTVTYKYIALECMKCYTHAGATAASYARLMCLPAVVHRYQQVTIEEQSTRLQSIVVAGIPQHRQHRTRDLNMLIEHRQEPVSSAHTVR